MDDQVFVYAKYVLTFSSPAQAAINSIANIS